MSCAQSTSTWRPTRTTPRLGFKLVGADSGLPRRQKPRSGDSEAHPTGFEPVTFGFVDRGRCSVGFVWGQVRA